MKPLPNAPYIEFFILADRAEVSGGKLYMMGGCWDRIQLPRLEPNTGIPVGIAMRVHVPQADAPRMYAIRLRVVDSPDPESIVPDTIQFVTNPAAEAITPMLAVLVATNAFIRFGNVGQQEVEATLDAGDTASVFFDVVAEAE